MKSAPTKEERHQVKRLIEESVGNALITEWEAEEFLPSLQEQSVWSEKQRDVLDSIWQKVFE